MQPPPTPQSVKGKHPSLRNMSMFNKLTLFIHDHIMYLNNSKFFAGIIMILLNVGSKFISIQFSKSTEEYMKFMISKQILVFAMAWMGTRDIYTSIGLTAAFTVLSEFALNEESPYCLVPERYRVLHTLIDTNEDGAVTATEMAVAVALLERHKKEEMRKKQKESFLKFQLEKI
jgi:hypothetical protein